MWLQCSELPGFMACRRKASLSLILGIHGLVGKLVVASLPGGLRLGVRSKARDQRPGLKAWGE